MSPLYYSLFCGRSQLNLLYRACASALLATPRGKTHVYSGHQYSIALLPAKELITHFSINPLCTFWRYANEGAAGHLLPLRVVKNWLRTCRKLQLLSAEQKCRKSRAVPPVVNKFLQQRDDWFSTEDTHVWLVQYRRHTCRVYCNDDLITATCIK